MSTFANMYIIKKVFDRRGPCILYEANNNITNQEVIIKTIASNITDELDISFQHRFKRTLGFISSFNNPIMVPILHYGIFEDQYFIVTPFMKGGSLRDLLKVEIGGLHEQKAVDIFTRIGQCVAAAHKHSILHLSIKPSNILFDEQGIAFISDFEIGNILFDLNQSSTIAITNKPLVFMAPEQAINKKSPQVDIYQLGLLFYSLLTGKLPFNNTNFNVNNRYSVCEIIPTLPKYFDEIISQCLKVNPADRYKSVTEILSILTKYPR
jgi:eukaryotic-like serine/threonine-protein kinase